MKIHIVGASGAGSTTLGTALAEQLGYPYLDTDHYFWEPSEQPFTIKRNPARRIAMLRNDAARYSSHIIGGSLVSWGDEWLTAFNLVVFLYIPPVIRMARLKKREFDRYGDVIYTNPERVLAYKKFMDWAKAYDTNAISGRTLHVHEAWLNKVKCPVLEIRGDTTVQQRIARVLNKMESLPRTSIN